MISPFTSGGAGIAFCGQDRFGLKYPQLSQQNLWLSSFGRKAAQAP
jgi:hypothetical protein